jgi:CRISPR type III-associated protein (TIGR04423 family)
MNKSEIKNYVESLEGYQGYIQYSNRAISKGKDIFVGTNPKVEYEDGFIYEAHFCNGSKSVTIKQVNDNWLVSETDISQVSKDDIQTYKSDIQDWDYDIKMAQIWQSEPDALCKSMNVKKLNKVVFAGFEKGEAL